MVTSGVSAARRLCLTMHLRGAEALGPRGADVVLAHRLQHEGARHPDVAGHVDQRQRECRAGTGRCSPGADAAVGDRCVDAARRRAPT